jgi:hypothetical protein
MAGPEEFPATGVIPPRTAREVPTEAPAEDDKKSVRELFPEDDPYFQKHEQSQWDDPLAGLK